ELKTSPGVPAHFDNRNMTLLQTLDLTVHDLDRYGYVINHKKTVKKRANMNTEIRRAQKKPRNQEKSTMVKLQSKKVKPWSTEVNH
ncbi:hypothetical protein Tco_1423356, partial [Tanacetum coccineum]